MLRQIRSLAAVVCSANERIWRNIHVTYGHYAKGRATPSKSEKSSPTVHQVLPKFMDLDQDYKPNNLLLLHRWV